MSSQKGAASRTRGQKYQNTTVFKNDKYGASPQVKKANAKVHDGVCQRCKDILEWKVKYSKYKSLTQPRKCVKCLQKTVKDAYHIMCRTCALQLQLCAKCGKSEEVVIPLDKKEEEEVEEEEPKGNRRRKKRGANQTDEEDEFDDLDDYGEMDSDCDSEETEK
ncbi:uncharacterized protein C9orf85 homolog [Pangasianodon hypophthalmus]|uniref:uncharacterized protein C9orf85 homolog n=1 Tax=Pangasianodon hypophthalmus TaxID=310915 RepID=UPI002307C70F|nr:uncharacterized protein C9orf85 homolog [Pangasianodon hypophthalmus]